MMPGPKGKLVTRVALEFLNHIIHVFEKFLLLFQKSCPVVHILYDSLCDILMKLLRRFIKPRGLENKYGSDLAFVDCTMFQLPEKRNGYWRKHTADQQKIALPGMRSLFKATASYLKEKLPLGNEFLRQLGCLYPTERHKQSAVLSIHNIASVLQPEINSLEVVDEWKVFPVDS